MARSKGKKQQQQSSSSSSSASRHEEGKRNPTTSGKSQPSTKIDPSVVAASSAPSKHNADLRTQASQGRNSNRRSLFMAGDLFKRNTSTTATNTNHAVASTANPPVNSGVFVPERTPMNQRLKDSDTSSIRSNSSVRSNIAQRLRRVFSTSNMFDKGRSNDSDHKHDRKKEFASAPGSRPDTPDNIAHQAKKQSSTLSPNTQSRSSTSTQRSRESTSQRRRAGSTSSERPLVYQGYNSTTFANGTSGGSGVVGRPSFSSSSSSINSIQYRPGMVHTSSTGSVNSLGQQQQQQHSTTSFQPSHQEPRRGSTSSASTHRSRRSIYTTYNNEHTSNGPNGSNGGNNSIYSMYGGEDGSSTSVASAPANVTSQHGNNNNNNNNNGHFNFGRESRSASFHSTNGHSYSHYNAHGNGNMVNGTMNGSNVNHRRPAAPSPLGSGHMRALSFGSGTTSTNYSGGGNYSNQHQQQQHQHQQQHRALCSPQLTITPAPQMTYPNNNNSNNNNSNGNSNSNHLLHQQQFLAQPAPMMNANKVMNRHSWIPQVGRPASPYFSPANANSMSNSHPMNGPSHTPITPTFPAVQNNQTGWEFYRQRNLSEPVLNTCPTGQLSPSASSYMNNSLAVPGQMMSGTTDEYASQYNNTTSVNGMNANTAQKTMKTLTITEQGEDEEKLNSKYHHDDNDEDDEDDDDDSYVTTEDSEDEDEKPLGNRLFFGSRPGSQNGSNSSLASVTGGNGSTRNRPMPSRGILKVSGSSFGADMARIPSSPAPWSNRNIVTNGQTSNGTGTKEDTTHDLGIESALSTMSVSRSRSTSSTLSNEEVSSASSASSSSEALLTPASSTTTIANIDQLTQVSPTISASDVEQSNAVTPPHSNALPSPSSSSSSIHIDTTTSKGIAAMTMPPLTSNSATSIATSNVTITEKEVKRFRFNERVLVGETWHATEYDRRGESIIRLTPALAQAIKMELNEFKAKEMAVHEESRIYTHILA